MRPEAGADVAIADKFPAVKKYVAYIECFGLNT
jgi:hypothetical protein